MQEHHIELTISAINACKILSKSLKEQPYAIIVIVLLLTAFGHRDSKVRQEAENTLQYILDIDKDITTLYCPLLNILNSSLCKNLFLQIEYECINKSLTYDIFKPSLQYLCKLLPKNANELQEENGRYFPRYRTTIYCTTNLSMDTATITNTSRYFDGLHERDFFLDTLFWKNIWK